MERERNGQEDTGEDLIILTEPKNKTETVRMGLEPRLQSEYSVRRSETERGDPSADHQTNTFYNRKS